MLQQVQSVKNNDPYTLIQKAEVISFDVFDTAIIRPFLHHHDMYHPLEKILNFHNFHKFRIGAVKFTRKLLIDSSRQKEEVTVLDIYEHIHIDKQHAINQEILFDVSICRQRKFVFQLYQYAINSGKRVIFVTDITYSKKAIMDILHQNGYTVYEKLFVSSEYNLSKSSGGMYKQVIIDTKISPRKILHIGDSIKSDIQQARKNEFRPLYIPRPYHSMQKIIDEKQFKMRINALNSALYASASNIALHDPRSTISQHLIYTFPFVYKTVMQVLNTKDNLFLIKRDANNALFNIFYKVYSMFASAKVLEININYLYVSSIKTFDDLIKIKNIVTDEHFYMIVKECYQIYSTDVDVLRQKWHDIELKTLGIRKITLEYIGDLSGYTVYSFTKHKNIKVLIEIAIGVKIPSVIHHSKVMKKIIKLNVRRTIMGKPSAKKILHKMQEITHEEAKFTIFPQIEYFFSTLANYIKKL